MRRASFRGAVSGVLQGCVLGPLALGYFYINFMGLFALSTELFEG